MTSMYSGLPAMDDEQRRKLQLLGVRPIAPPNAPTPVQGDVTPPETGLQPIAQPKLEPMNLGTPSPVKPLSFHERQRLPIPGAPGTSPNTTGQLQKLQDQQANPWGTPENHPGFGGKLGHVLGTIGNIAGDIVAPGVMANIPGTQLNRQVQERKLTGELEKEKGQESTQKLQEAQAEADTARAETEKKNVESEIPLRGAQTREADARALLAQNPQFKTPQEGYAAAIQAVLAKGGDPSKDPNVQRWADAIQSVQKDAGQTAAEETARAEAIRQKKTLGQTVTPEEDAFLKAHVAEKTIVPQAQFTLNQPGKNDARTDRSYQMTSGQLDKVQTPIDATVQRLGRLEDTLSQGTPQADALVAPELLTVMAGGMGSGLRMNEAEIARIVGGRSAWENLRASIQHWAVDPAAARSITPSQQQQIQSLVKTVHDKLAAKQAILDDAREKLINAEDPQVHRQIMAETRKQLSAIDNGQAQGGGGQEMIRARDPQGKLHEAPKGTPLPAGWKPE